MEIYWQLFYLLIQKKNLLVDSTLVKNVSILILGWDVKDLETFVCHLTDKEKGPIPCVFFFNNALDCKIKS